MFPGDVPSQRPSATRASSPRSHLSLLARPGGQIWGTCQGEVGRAGAEEIHAAPVCTDCWGGWCLTHFEGSAETGITRVVLL